MLSEWMKMVESLGITSKSPTVLQKAVQFILDKVLLSKLNLKNEMLLQTLEEEADNNLLLEKSEEESFRYIAEYSLCSLKKELKVNAPQRVSLYWSYSRTGN